MLELNQPLGKTIAHLGKDIHTYLGEKLADFNLGSGQFFVIIRVYENEGVCQDELSKILNIDKTTVAKSVKKVIKEGYIIKKRDENDKRYHRLYVSEKGRETYVLIKKILAEAEEKFMSGFNDEELLLFISFLDRVKNNIKLANNK